MRRVKPSSFTLQRQSNLCARDILQQTFSALRTLRDDLFTSEPLERREKLELARARDVAMAVAVNEERNQPQTFREMKVFAKLDW